LDISSVPHLLHMTASSFAISLENPRRAVAGKIPELILFNFVKLAKLGFTRES